MSEDADKESKTEEATEKKISDAVEKGNIPLSREMTVFVSLVGILGTLAFLVSERLPPLVAGLSRLIDDAGGYTLPDASAATVLGTDIALAVAAFLIPVVAVLAVLGIVGSVSQHAPKMVLERIRPQWNRVSPMGGFKRLFGVQGFAEFLRSLTKFAAVGIACAVLLQSELRSLVDAIYTDPTLLPAQILSMSTRLVATVCAATIVLVAADLVWSRFKWRRDLRMSRQEIKDEMKQAEGDPMVKARLRSIAKDRARRRMLTAVPRATLVIANPTHYAIALRYERDAGGAPLVVAKGTDLVALKIREIAAKHDIPVIEDRQLARAMYDAVEVDRWIPPEFYHAVARILYFIYAREGHGQAR